MSKFTDALERAGFEVYTRKEWGSHREADGSYARRAKTHTMPSGPADYHYLHLSVTRDTNTVAEGAAGARQIEGYGYSTPPMVSYHALVTNEGRIYEGQSFGVKGTHTVNDKKIGGFPLDLNREGYAVALMQNVDDEVTDVQVRAVAAAFAEAEIEGWVKKGAPILPHRKFAWKSCPGDRAMARLPEIQRLKDKYVREGLPNPGSVQKLRQHLYRAAKAVEKGQKAEARKQLFRAATEAPNLGKPILTAKLWAMRRELTRDDGPIPIAARKKAARQLWGFRRKHTRPNKK